MSLLGKKFPAPVARPMTPFFAAGAVILYGINSIANTLMQIIGQARKVTAANRNFSQLADEFKNDPRNPNAKNPKH